MTLAGFHSASGDRHTSASGAYNRERLMVANWRTLLFVLAVLLGPAGTAGAQILQAVPKEMAQALQLEQQAAARAAEGRLAEAEALYKESLGIAERVMPGNDPVLAGSLNNVGQFYRAQKRFAEAAPLFKRALPIYVTAYGENHTLTATVVNNLGNTYLADRKFDLAEPLLARGLASTKTLMGPEHASVAISLDWLAQARFFQGRYADAETDLRHAIAVAEKSTGPQSQLVVVLLDHMISVVRAQGREQEAAALKERAQKIVAEAKRASPAVVSAQQPETRLIVLQSQDKALVDSSPVTTRDIVAHLTARSSGQGQLPMVNIQSCAKVPADAVQGLMKELQAKKFIPVLDLHDPDVRHCSL
jgi:tetratricopeptide (TPR) repeat protein